MEREKPEIASAATQTTAITPYANERGRFEDDRTPRRGFSSSLTGTAPYTIVGVTPRRLQLRWVLCRRPV